MIVALLSILFSMYLLYVVPLQGRDSEISHLESVKQQFVDIKSDIDSLIISNRTNMEVSRIIPLGTKGATQEGSFSIIPLQSFSASGGKLKIDKDSGTLISTVGSNSWYNVQKSGIKTNQVPSGNWQNNDVDIGGGSLYSNSPDTLNISYTTNSLSSPRVILVNSSDNRWSVNITAIPRYVENIDKYVLYSTAPTDFSGFLSTQYDLVITVIKNNNNILTDSIIQKNINVNTPYLVNIYNGAYGLKDSIFSSFNFSVKNNGVVYPASGFFSARQLINKPYEEDPTDVATLDPISADLVINPSSSLPLGSLRFSSNNKYWLNQDFVYQMGSVFVEQSEDSSISSSIILLPGISIGLIPGEASILTEDNVSVTVRDIRIKGISGEISGSISPPLYGKVESITENYVQNKSDPYDHQLSSDIPNARYIWLKFGPSTDIDKWYKTLTRSVNIAKENAPNLYNHVVVFKDDESANLIIGKDIHTYIIPGDDGYYDGTVQDNLDKIVDSNIFVQYYSSIIDYSMQSGEL